jgi:TetR/AcrR family transcriptional regulator, cholesterol catabolism regulator
MREIARRVGTSLSNLYNYYPSKAALLADVLDSGNQALYSAMLSSGLGADSEDYEEFLEDFSDDDEVSASGSRPPLSAVELVCAATEYSLNNPVIMRVALTEAKYLEGEDREKVHSGQLKCIRVLRDAIRAHFDFEPPSEIEPHFAARSIMLLTAHLPVWLKSDTPVEQRRLTDQHVQACARLMGIAA